MIKRIFSLQQPPDHVFHKSQFRDFIREQAETPEGKKGDIELIIKGDFLEFAQVNQQA